MRSTEAVLMQQCETTDTNRSGAPNFSSLIGGAVPSQEAPSNECFWARNHIRW